MGNFVKITNSAGLDVNVLNSSTSDHETNTLYENTLTLLETSNETTLHQDNKTAYFNVGDNSGANLQHSLLIINPDTLSPISSSVVSKVNDSYGSITVTEQEKAQIDLAKKFYQHIRAFPGSDVNLGFAQAIGETQKPSGATSDKNAVDEYFKQGSELYRRLDFSSVMAEASYENNYAETWSDLKPKDTYYLYTPLESVDTSVQAPKLVGTLEFAKHNFSSSEYDLKKGYTITFKGKKDSSVEFYQGWFSDEDSILRLAPTFIKKSLLTGVEGEELMVVLVGTIDKLRVIGTTKKQELDANAEDSWYALYRPKAFQQAIDFLTTVIGITYSIYLTAKFAWWIVKKAEEKPVMKKTREEAREEIQLVEEKQNQDYQEFANDDILPPSVDTVSSNPYGVIKKAKQDSIHYFLFLEAYAQFEAIQKAKSALQELEKSVGSSQNTQKMLWELKQHQNNLQNILSSDKKISIDKSLLEKNNEIIERVGGEIRKIYSAAVSKMLKFSREQVEQMTKDLTKLKNVMQAYRELRVQVESK